MTEDKYPVKIYAGGDEIVIGEATVEGNVAHIKIQEEFVNLHSFMSGGTVLGFTIAPDYANKKEEKK